jgi:glutamate receptor, ionotropic, invertebrate
MNSYTKMWQAMQEAGLPETLEEAVERVQISRSSSEGFAFLGKNRKNLNKLI